jgi:hypothetical protein
VAVLKVKVGSVTYHLPFVDLIPFDAQQLARLRDSIREQGRVRVPVLCWQDKRTDETEWVVDGAHRVLVAAELGLVEVPRSHAAFDSEQAAREECQRLNRDRRHLTAEQLDAMRQERIERVVERREAGESIRSIAESEGIAIGTVASDLKVASTVQGRTVEPVGGKVTGKDGRTRTATPRKPKPEPAEQFPATDDDPEPDTTPEDKMQEHNLALERWCRGLMDYFKTLPDDPWLASSSDTGGSRAVIKQKLKNCCAMVRDCKGKRTCPTCGGLGCGSCRQIGHLPAFMAKQPLGER